MSNCQRIGCCVPFQLRAVELHVKELLRNGRDLIGQLPLSEWPEEFQVFATAGPSAPEEDCLISHTHSNLAAGIGDTTEFVSEKEEGAEDAVDDESHEGDAEEEQEE